MEQAESSYWQKTKHFFAVLVPIFIAQTAIVSVGFFDSVMAGHVSEQDLAGVAVGVNIFMPFYIACLATISGLTPRIAQLYGGQQHAEIRAVVQQGFYAEQGGNTATLRLQHAAVGAAQQAATRVVPDVEALLQQLSFVQRHHVHIAGGKEH